MDCRACWLVLAACWQRSGSAQLQTPIPGPIQQPATRVHDFRRTSNLEERRACVASPESPPVFITAAFDGGNIEMQSADCSAEGKAVVRLRIRADPFSQLEQKSFMQWFAFRASPSSGSTTSVRYEIVNAGDAAYSSAWAGSAVCSSPDRRAWSRCWNTAYDAESGTLSWEYDHAATNGMPVYFSYFDLYPYDRHLDLIARVAASPRARVVTLGQTLEGRDLECVLVGSGPIQAWVIHRQHPGESMASFFAEGLLGRLLGFGCGGKLDGVAQRLLKAVTFHIVPHMNPDGASRGHLRTNAGGANLNREWASSGEYEAPSRERSPEVFHTLAAMERTGVDFFMDVHGEEELPYAFAAGAEGCSVWGPRLEKLHGAFVAHYGRANADMQGRVGYEPDEPGTANPAIARNHVSQRFDCLGMTLEMPFKDIKGNAASWSSGPRIAAFDGQRAAALGSSLVEALDHVAAQLRANAPNFGGLFGSKADDYVRPTSDYKNM